jgi:cytochrome c peroxidase
MISHNNSSRRAQWLLAVIGATGIGLVSGAAAIPSGEHSLDAQLSAVLTQQHFTGDIQNQLERKLGRKVDRGLANLGRMLWFDSITGLNDDNACGGCHSPTAGFGDTQSIAIGIDNNGIVGPNREGPRNQRRTPMVLNTAFYPRLMWNGRFEAVSGNPFDNSAGFLFPQPEGASLSYLPHLLDAQAFIPPTERVEAAGFHIPGDNFALRAEVLNRLNHSPVYRRLFGRSFPEVSRGDAITFDMFARATSEFEFTLTFANAPVDRFARGERGAMTPQQKRGALLFFGKANCVSCHAVSGRSNEMFSDFQNWVAGTPQVNPSNENVVFDGPGQNEDFGLEQVTGNPADRYKFRTAPLRNAALQPAFFHNGAFTSLESAIRFHLDAAGLAPTYTPNHLDSDLIGPIGPVGPVLERLDPRLADPPSLSESEIRDLIAFVRDGLLDPDARPEKLRKLIPNSVPSGRPLFQFE